MNRIIKYLFGSLLILIIQCTFANLIALDGITPDFLLILIVIIALVYGKIPAMVFAFILGFLFDSITGGILGLSSLSKVMAAFVAGSFYNENKTSITLGSYKFILIILLSSLVHNSIYFFIFLQGTEFNFWRMVFRYGITTAFYTTMLSTLVVFYFSRKYSLIKNA